MDIYVFLKGLKNFNLTGTDEFVEKVISVVEEELTVSKVEQDIFRFIGVDMKVVTNGIKILIEDYSQSLKDITDIRKTDERDEELSKLEMQLYRKYTGKIAWLANSTRPTFHSLLSRGPKITRKPLYLIFMT